MGHTRYITSDERCKAIAEGIYLYSKSIDERAEGIDLTDSWKARWGEWRRTWGDKMAAQVIQVNYDNMTWAINYRD